MTAMKPRLFSYVVARDYGFAPNPFFGYCTLANCKPKIRKAAKVGDWVIGTSSPDFHNTKNHLVYFMKITKTLTFNEFFNDSKFQKKKPNLKNVKPKHAYGDNIYHYKDGEWHQLPSHHRKDKKNKGNLNSDIVKQPSNL